MAKSLIAVTVFLFAIVGCTHPIARPDEADRKVAESHTANPMTDWDRRILSIRNHKTPLVEIYGGAGSNYRLDSMRGMVTFPTYLRFKNKSTSQIAEVDVVLKVTSASTGQEIYRTPSQKATVFHSTRLPNVGPLEAVTHTSRSNQFDFSIPTRLWTTDAVMQPAITRVVAVQDDSNLHDFGNLISYMMWHPESEIKAAFLKDPSLFRAKNSVGLNSAMIAAGEGFPSLLDFMVTHGADLHARTGAGRDALYCAVTGNFPKMLDHLVKKGFSVNEQFGPSKVTPLMAAIDAGMSESFSWLLAHGANPNARNKVGWTPLIFAVMSKELIADQFFDQLVAKGADIHCRLPNGYGLMHLGLGMDVTREKLLKLGFSVEDRVPGTGVTPLMVAAEEGMNKSAKWLLQHGADINAVDSKGQTVFDHAKMSNTLNTDRFFRREIGLSDIGSRLS